MIILGKSITSLIIFLLPRLPDELFRKNNLHGFLGIVRIFLSLSLSFKIRVGLL